MKFDTKMEVEDFESLVHQAAEAVRYLLEKHLESVPFAANFYTGAGTDTKAPSTEGPRIIAEGSTVRERWNRLLIS
jgi:hypothetical protein